MSKSTADKAKLYFTLIDIVKAMKLRVKTAKEINGLTRIENNLNKLVMAIIVKD